MLTHRTEAARPLDNGSVSTKTSPAKEAAPEITVIAVNRRARADYDILETLEAGIALTGAEIKSVRERRVSIVEAYVHIRNNQAELLNCNISPYSAAGRHGQQDPQRPRKLLLHRREAARLGLEASRQRLTIVPLRLYIKGHVAKVEIGLARGRRKYEKRDVIQQREADREMGRDVRGRG